VTKYADPGSDHRLDLRLSHHRL